MPSKCLIKDACMYIYVACELNQQTNNDYYNIVK